MSSAGPGAGHSVALDEAAAESYLARAAALLREARLGAQFPSARAVLATLEALSQRCHRGLYPQLQVDAASGLPALKEWTRVLTDVQLAKKLLAGLPPLPELQERAPRDPAYGKQLLKYLYFTRLQQKPPPPVEQLTVALQRLWPQSGTAQVQLTLDKLDARGLLLRCTVELCQGPSPRPLVRRDGEQVAATPELHGLLYRLAAHDAELLFIELFAQPGVQPRRVCIGTIGPLYLAELPQPSGLGALLRGPGAALGSFGLTTAASELAEGRDNDPLSQSMCQRLSAPARAQYDKTRQRLGYHVTRDRKFVADPDSLPHLLALCQQAGTRNVIYPLGGAQKSPPSASCHLPKDSVPLLKNEA
jgi:hypothetical protein